METISVIVPLYKGYKYIADLIDQMEKCAEISRDCKIELIFSNDDPQHLIPENIVSEKIAVKTVNTDMNNGIHRARIKGFLHSCGDYVLFLDQDDKVTPEYFHSQLKEIGSSDAVVCNALSGGRLKYNTDRPLYKTIRRESMINEGNMILSPGQVLLRRDAIPKSWIEETIKNNGADDWFLWLCMHSEGKRFAVNSEVLFIREVHYHNASLDSTRMSMSEQEVVKIIEENHLLQAEERNRLRELLPKLQEIRIRENEKWKKMFLIQNDWFRISNRGLSIAHYLEDRKVKKIAIYGYGYLGKTLLENLEHENIEVSYVIDKNAAFLSLDKKCYTVGDTLEQVDAVIITLMSDNNVIEDRLKEKLDGKIFWLEDMILDISR